MSDSVSEPNEKTTKKTTTPEVGSLVPQPNGRGALRYGGTNKGGTGRPPNALRGSMREILEKGLPHLEEFVTGDAKPSDQLRAIKIAAKFGLDVKVDKSLVDELWQAIELHVPDESRPALKREFSLIVGRRLAEAVVT